MAVQSGLKGYGKQQLKQQGDMLGRGAIKEVVQSHHLAYNFYVEINGRGFSFKKVSGLEVETDFEEIHEGGYNMGVHRMRNLDSGHHILTLEYGSTTFSSMLDTLEPGRYLPEGVYVTSLNQKSSMSGKMFQLEGCYLKKINFSDFDAEQSAVMINRMEIVYSRLTLPKMI